MIKFSNKVQLNYTKGVAFSGKVLFSIGFNLFSVVNRSIDFTDIILHNNLYII